MTEFSKEVSLWVTKGIGSIIGSAISIAYLLPKGPREAAIRFGIGVLSGLIFGTAVGVKISYDLGIYNILSIHEKTLIGAAMASLFGWWLIGVVFRIKIGEKMKTHKEKE